MPYNHLQGKGCQFCANNIKYTIEDFIEKSNKVHSFKYEYPDKNYINNITPINILCKDHGLFKQYPNSHLKGVGCPKCSGNRKLTIEEFINLANIKHNNIYYYPDKNYNNYDSEISIGCYKHGIFKQVVRNHLTGRGCPICQNSKGELFIKKILDCNNINYKQQYKFEDLKYKDLLKFDFAILNSDNSVKYLIEFNGEQHYKFKVKFHKTEAQFKISKNRDKLKVKYCNQNNLKLYIIKYSDDIELLMNKILKQNHKLYESLNKIYDI
jgi:Zn finger protein HypA/HybF involved in hydrogenase expression